MIHVRIQREDCTSCSTCWETCPEVFEQNEDDRFSQITERFRAKGILTDGEIPDELKNCVEDAVESCPVSIITIVDA
ncbi:MAG: Ferredoxin [Methanoregulaceae archaeon PtaU1.Bin222]|nr:MAG: Ferredoxin [Methanoregulaceae archaeon PtaU1.Bin222]